VPLASPIPGGPFSRLMYNQILITQAVMRME